MTYLDQDESNEEEYGKITERLISVKGRAFRLICMDPHGYWKVHHATNNKPVNALQGHYTSYRDAEKAINALPEELLPKIMTKKTVLTPKIKNEEDSE